MLARILLLGSLAASATALHSHHQRPSLNFGSNTPRKVTADASHPVLSAFNANAATFVSAASAGAGASAFETGLSVAESFLKQIHPQQEFRLQSKTRSAGGSVVHAYYVQVVGGRDVVDGLVNINVDTASGAIISYGDSAFAPTSAAACITAPVAGAHSGSQFVFGSANAAASSADAEKCTLAAKETVDTQAAPIDPRAAIVSFLLQAAPSHLAAISSLDDLVEGISVTQMLHSEGDGSGYDVRLAGVPGALKEVPAKLSYIQREDGTLALTWSFEYESQENWYEAHVSAGQDAPDSATPLMVVDWVRDAPSHGGHDDDTSKPGPKKPEPKPEPKLEYSYKVFPWSVNDPSEGKREIVRSPANMEASLDGWHQISSGAGRSSGNGVASPASSSSDGALYEPGWSSRLDKGATFKDTRGNNVFASANPSGGTAYELNHRPKHDETGAFKYHLGYRSKEKAHEPLDPTTYIDASITELFYTINEIHDLTWHYGFDEESGNFQSHNFGRGGLGGDPVVAFAQDGSGMNNANFATPPDGTSGRMRMYKWSGQTEADGDLEAGIVIHEYTHGISTRLTGGPANSGCLGWGQSGGMGEGYGDFLATMIRMKDGKVHDWTMGEWAAHRAGAGIRPHPYSTNKTVNPDVFSTLNKGGYWQVHAIGSVYAEMLFEVAEALIAEHGWSPSLFPPAANRTSYDSFYATSSVTGRRYPRHGNTYAVQLLIDSFKLQPCRPNFLDNRDAILQADQVYTGGENACTIWRAFAKRGLGPQASVRGSTPWGGGVHTDDFGIPKKCLSKRRVAV